jgi:hypothetical protein
MIGFRFGNERARQSRVPFTGGITRHNLRFNPGRFQASRYSALAQWR